MKAIILAGGRALRLHPISIAVNKQLLPVWDKPMIYYPLSTVIEQGCDEILVISAPEYTGAYRALFDRLDLGGVSIELLVQENPCGLAHAYILARSWLRGESSILILGDNIFHAPCTAFHGKKEECTVFAARVDDPSRYGVISWNGTNYELEEKPAVPKSKLAVVGLYRFPGDAPERAELLTPSARGELEIIDLIRTYASSSTFKVGILGQESAWIDAGTVESLHDAGSYVRAVQSRSGRAMGSPEVSAVLAGFLSKDIAMRNAATASSAYGAIVQKTLQEI